MLSSLSTTVAVIGVVFPVLDVVSVILRWVARRRAGRKLGADEHFTFLAVGLAVGLGITTLFGVGYEVIGNTTPLQQFSTDQSNKFQIIAWVQQLLYVLTCSAVKLSILYYYKRIFVTPSFQIQANIMLGISIAWLIAFFFAVFFECRNILQQDNLSSASLCIDRGALFIAQSSLSMVLDIVILCLPIRSIMQLQMTSNNKFAVSAIIGIGFFCVVAAAVRVYFSVQFSSTSTFASANSAEVITDIDIWTVIEPCASIICACLPTFAPLVPKQFSATTLVNRTRSIFGRGKNPTSTLPISTQAGFAKGRHSNATQPGSAGSDTRLPTRTTWNDGSVELTPLKTVVVRTSSETSEEQDEYRWKDDSRAWSLPSR